MSYKARRVWIFLLVFKYKIILLMTSFSSKKGNMDKKNRSSAMPHTNNQYLSHFIVIIPLALSSTTFFGRKEKKKAVKVPYSLLTFNIK